MLQYPHVNYAAHMYTLYLTVADNAVSKKKKTKNLNKKLNILYFHRKVGNQWAPAHQTLSGAAFSWKD